MNIIIKKNTSIDNNQPKVYDLGQIDTDLQDLLDASTVLIESDQTVILKVTDLDDNVNYYLLPLPFYKNGNSVYGLGNGLTESDLILIGGSGSSSTVTLQDVLNEDGVVTDGSTAEFLNGTDNRLRINGNIGVEWKDLTFGGYTIRLQNKGFYITEDEDVVEVPNWVMVSVENPISQGGDIIIPTIDALESSGYVIVNQIKTVSFSALNGIKYTTNGTLTVTDPTPVENRGFIVHVIGGTTTIDGVDYTSGALVYRFYNGTVWASKNYGLSIANDFANDASASVGGISIGDLYHTAGVVKIRLS